MRPVRWTEQAVADVQAIRRFIERDSPRYGRIVAERLIQSTFRLETFPASGRVVPDLDRPDVRELIVGEYRIVYRLDEDAVVLLTFFRSSRLFPVDEILDAIPGAFERHEEGQADPREGRHGPLDDL